MPTSILIFVFNIYIRELVLCKGKGKIHPITGQKAQGGNRGTALLFL